MLEKLTEIDLLLLDYTNENKAENLKKLEVNMQIIGRKIIEITKEEPPTLVLNYIEGIEKIFKQLKITQLLILQKKKQLREQIKNL